MMFENPNRNPIFTRGVGSAYISIDGPEFVGKSTVIKKIDEYLKNRSETYLVMKEPGSFIRPIVLGKEHSLEMQMELFRADRILQQQLIVKPMLMKGGIVVSDRSVIASYVYQGFMSGGQKPGGTESAARVVAMHDMLPEFIYPDLCIIAQCPIEIAAARALERKAAGGEMNHIDLWDQATHQHLHNYFNMADAWCPTPFAYVDFSKTPDEILVSIIAVVEERLKIIL